jgi:hypothetical protein
MVPAMAGLMAGGKQADSSSAAVALGEERGCIAVPGCFAAQGCIGGQRYFGEQDYIALKAVIDPGRATGYNTVVRCL